MALQAFTTGIEARGANVSFVKAILYTDGASQGNPGPAGIGTVLMDENGQILAKSSEPIGFATNNQAECRALIDGLKLAAKHGVTHLTWCSDSELVVRQWTGEYSVKDSTLQKLFLEAHDLAQQFQHMEARHIPRETNRIADQLARKGVKANQKPKSVKD